MEAGFAMLSMRWKGCNLSRFGVVLAALAAWGATERGSAEAVEASRWPEPEAVAYRQGTPVTFPSHSPFALVDAGQGPERDPPRPAQGQLFLPDTLAETTPVPAVVLLHGASGVQDARDPTYARQFAEMGIAALVVDVFGARRDLATGFTERLLNITEAMYLADAYSALRYLSGIPGIDSRRVALIGFSYGGMAATYAAYAQVAERFAPNGERFVAHAAFYAPCVARFEDSRATGAPLLMLYGTGDAMIDPARCDGIAAALEAGGADVQKAVYPGAVHQWDGAWGRRRMRRNIVDCDFVVEPDATVRDADWQLPMTNPFIRKLMLAFCADDDGYELGRDDTVRAQSNRDLGRFLSRAFVAD